MKRIIIAAIFIAVLFTACSNIEPELTDVATPTLSGVIETPSPTPTQKPSPTPMATLKPSSPLFEELFEFAITDEIIKASEHPPQGVMYPYYFVQEDFGWLCRIDQENADMVKICRTYEGSFVIIEDYVFWGDRNGLYRMDSQGSQTQLFNKAVQSIAEQNGIIYFCSKDEENSGIFSMKFDGTDLTRLFDKVSNSLTLTDDYIFFAVFGEYEEPPQGDSSYPSGTLSRMNFDGSDFVDFDICVWEMFAYDGKIYYNDWDDNTLYVMDTDLSTSQVLPETGWETDMLIFWRYFIYDDYVYMEEGYKISRMSLDGSEYTVLFRGNTSLWGVFNDYIYFTLYILSEYDLGYYGLCRIKIDGTDFAMLY